MSQQKIIYLECKSNLSSLMSLRETILVWIILHDNDMITHCKCVFEHRNSKHFCKVEDLVTAKAVIAKSNAFKA